MGTRLAYRVALKAFIPISLLVALVFFRILLGSISLGSSDDFLAFYTGASLIREGTGSELYSPQYQLDEQARIVGRDPANWRLQAYFNPPVWAAVIAPLTLLPLSSAFRVFAGFEILLLLICVVLFLQLVRITSRPKKWLFAWGVLTMAPCLYSVTLGQTTLATLASVVSAALIMPKRPAVAGAVLSLVAVKPQIALPFLLVLIMARQWSTVRGFCLGATTLIVVSFLLVGAHGFAGEARLYLDTWNASGVYGLAVARQQNWTGFVYGVLPSYAGTLNPLGLAVTSLGAVAAAWSVRKVASPNVLLGTACLIALVSSPHLHTYDLALIAVAGAAVLAAGPTSNGVALLMLGWYYFLFFAVVLSVLGLSFTVFPLIGTLVWFVRWAREHAEMSTGAGILTTKI